MARNASKRRAANPTLGKWGNSVGIRLPKQILEISGIGLSDPLTIHAEKDRIVIERRRRRITLAGILRTWPKGQAFKELDWGPTRVHEV